jgi:DNA repair protein RadC
MRRERYLHEGGAALGDVELVALLLETGSAGRTALAIAAELCELGGGLAGLARMQPQEWLGISGVGEARAVRLHAAIELGRRALVEAVPDEPIPDAEAAYGVLGPRLRSLQDEELVGLFLDRKHRPLACRRLTRGSDALTVVDPRQVFRVAVGVGASSVILAHNHPSGDPTPSPQDREVTLRVAHAGRVLGIPLLDHLICGTQSYVSLGAPLAPSPPGRWYVDDLQLAPGLRDASCGPPSLKSRPRSDPSP